MSMRIGQGFDVHAFAEGRNLIIGGIEIEHHLGLAGHSDADVLIHALCDAMLGAAGLGDIGKHFPDSDPKYKGADSGELLKQVVKLVGEQNWQLENADLTVIAEAPKLAPYIDKMRDRLAVLLGVRPQQVNVKATTTEKLGFTGRGEGIAAQAVVLLAAS